MVANTQLSPAYNPSNFTAQQLSGMMPSGYPVYPVDLDTSNFYMMFQFTEFQRTSIFDTGFQRAVGGVALPLPMELVDQQDIDYTSSSQNPIVGAAMENALQQADSMAGKVLNTLGGVGAGGAMQVAKQFANKLGPDSINQALQLAGVAQNPFLTILFNAPTFKHHQMTWRFTPRNATESALVTRITNQFKYHALPDITGASAGTMLTYPDMVHISICPDDTHLYKFKPCVIKTVKVNYNGSDMMPSFFNSTKAPVAVSMSLTLLETRYHVKSDWNVNYDGSVTQKSI